MTGPAADAPADPDRPWRERFWTAGYRPGVPAGIEDELARWPSVAALYEADTARFSDRPAFTSFGRTVGYGWIHDRARAFAAWLQAAGVAPGDRVALMMPNCLQYPAALFGTLLAGAVVVNVNPLYTAPELHHQLVDSGAVAIVVMEMYARTLQDARPGTAIRHVAVTAMGDMLGLRGLAITAAIRHLRRAVPRHALDGAVRWRRLIASHLATAPRPAPTGPDDLAFLQYTGGTTGAAKGAMLTNRNMVANILQGREWIARQLAALEDPTTVTLLPLYHIFALTTNLLTFTGIGGRNILVANPRDTAGTVSLLARERFHFLAGVNTLFANLLEEPAFRARDFSALRMTVAGGMPVQRDVALRWQAVTGRPLVEGYGLTECAPVVTVGPVDLDRPEVMGFSGRVGLPLPSTEVRMRREDGGWAGLGEPGELCVRGPQVMAGYWNRPEETAAALDRDGWLATGDVGVMEADGQVRLVDRIKDLILVSGFNVYPSEVEEVIASHPGVREVAVIAAPAPDGGETVEAIVVPRDPAPSAEAIVAHCRRSLTGYKIPRIVTFRSEPLPKTNVGKILRRALREARPEG